MTLAWTFISEDFFTVVFFTGICFFPLEFFKGFLHGHFTKVFILQYIIINFILLQQYNIYYIYSD